MQTDREIGESIVGWRCFGMARAAAGVVVCWAVALAFACWPANASAAGRYAAMMVDANTGHVLHAEAADEARYPASLTKMMTLYLLFEQLEQGRVRPDTRIRISAEAASTPPSRLGLEAGATISVADAAKALITKSANDVAVAIAEHIAGDERRFAELMTRKARELGMNATTFRNPHGLPDREQVTSARDMLTLAMRLYDTFPAYARLFATRTFQYAGRDHRNHNTMLDNFQGMEGIKTGYTTASGFNLVASVRRDGRHVIAAVFGGSSASDRNARMRVILNRGLLRASTEKTRKPLIVASRNVPSPVAAKRPVPVRLASARQAETAVRDVSPRETAPVLTEPVIAASRRSAAAPPRASVGSHEQEARVPAPDWRSTVRVAAPVAGDTSVASRLGSNWNTAVRPPSTLSAQAAQLSGRVAAAAPNVQAQPSVPVTPPTARFGASTVQIGAFGTATEARQKLEATRGSSPALSRAGMATPTVTINGRTLYRARFTGLDAASAATSCSDLRRRQIDCIVMPE